MTLYLGHFCAYLIIRWKYKLEYDNQADHGGLRVRKTKTGEQDLVVHQVTKHHKTKEQIHLQTGEQAVVKNTQIDSDLNGVIFATDEYGFNSETLGWNWEYR